MGFKEVNIKDIKFSPSTLIGEDWMVLSCGKDGFGHNAMTIGWGSFGTIWAGNKVRPTVTIFVRPQRYTHELLEQNKTFALSTLKDKKALSYLGSHSGKYSDKIRNAGLNVGFTDGTIYIEESEMVFICKKIYKGQIKEELVNVLETNLQKYKSEEKE